MLSLKYKFLRQRRVYFSRYKSYAIKKAFLHNSQISSNLRIHLSKRIYNIGKKSHTRIRNRCIISNRARGFIGHFKCSRIKFREAASFCTINGIRKSSW